MRSDDVARLLTSGGQGDFGFRQGTVISWDAQTGANVIDVGGEPFDNIPMLAISSVTMAAGDSVGVLRFKSTYFLLGRIAVAGSGSMQTRSAKVTASETRSSTSYGNLATIGPVIPDVYIGGSRQCLVLVRAAAGVLGNGADQANANVEVSGASSIAPLNTSAALIGSVGSPLGTHVQASIMSNVVLTAEEGLNEGFNTFTMVYKSGLGAQVVFSDRSLTVIPF